MVVDYTKRRPSTPATPIPGPAATSAADAGRGSRDGVPPSRVTLTKAAPSVSLVKSGPTGGILRVNLNWTARSDAAATGGFLKRALGGGSSAIDLDLGCLYEFTDGTKGAVQALGQAFQSRASFTDERVIWLDGDDRSGSNSGGENLFVDLAFAPKIRRILVFASIYEGAPNWVAANGVVTLYPASGPEIEVRLDEHDARSPMCAIALLENTGAGISVHREVRYIQGAQDALDRAYGWGMTWSRGRK